VLSHPELELVALGSDSLAGLSASALDPRLAGDLPAFVSNDEALAAEMNAYVERITTGLDTYLEATYIEAPGSRATPLPEGIFVGDRAYRWRIANGGTTITRGRA